MNLPTQNISEVIEQTRSYLGGVRQVLIKVAANLHFLKTNDNRPWAEVCEDLDISQGFSSKLISVYQHFVLEGGVDPTKLEGIDYEKLYLSAKTSGGIDEQLAKASTLTRGELRISHSEDTPHEPEYHLVCTTCWVSKENHG